MRRQFSSLLNRRSIRLRQRFFVRSCGRVTTVALGRDDRFDARRRDLVGDRIRIVAAIGKECFDPIGDHAEQRGKALHVMRLAGRQDEAERQASGIAPGMQLCGEAAS